MIKFLLALAVSTVLSPLAAMPGAAARGEVVPTCFGEEATLVATQLGEPFRGTPGPDVIVARPGTRVRALAGDDLVCGSKFVSGGSGDDLISYAGRAAVGSSRLHGDTGDDRIEFDSSMRATIKGGDGDDVIRTSLDSRVRVLGMDGDDVVATGGWASIVDGGDGNDVIRGGPGSDLLLGGDGADFIKGGDSPDSLSGGAGSDDLFGQAGNDFFEGGWGVDVATAGTAGGPPGPVGNHRDVCAPDVELQRGC